MQQKYGLIYYYCKIITAAIYFVCMNLTRITLVCLSLLLTACGVTYTTSNVQNKFYTPGSPEAAITDSIIMTEIAPYKIRLDSIMSEVISVSTGIFEKGQPESSLGNFVSDLCMEIINVNPGSFKSHPADFCVLNNGGLRSSLPAGNILLRNAFELMPFENELVIITLKGATLEKLFTYISVKGGVPVSGMNMKISEERYTEVTINNLPFQEQKTYRVLTSDYLASGGDSMSFFSDSLKAEPTGIKVRDAIIMYLRNQKSTGQIISPKTDGRISK